MDSKDFAAKIKAAGPDDGLEDGQFTAYASVFGNVDSYGDVVVKGAFADDLKAWESSGAPIPLLWGHDMADMFNNIGHVIEASEDDRGLLVKAQIDTSTANGAQAYRLIKGRRVTDLSFAYDVQDAAPGELDGQKVLELHKLKLYEVSVVPIGANRETEFLAVKRAAEHLAAEVKAGRVISAKNESALRTAHESIGSVLAALGDDQGKASGEPEAKSGASGDDPSGAKPSVSAEEPKAGPSVDLLAAQANIYALMGQEGVPS